MARERFGLAKAYVKIWVKAGREKEVQDHLLNYDEVQTADITAGEQDILSLVEAKNYEELLDLVMTKLRAVDGVEKTVTNLILEDRNHHRKAK
jgi:DNA-binding Lrp family transcriptional regulator